MKKKDWGNAVWFLFHTLAFKLKDEYISELPNLVSHIFIICNNLPCPNCKSHAVEIMKKGMKGNKLSTKDNLINFLWEFHNSVNKKIKSDFFTKDKLSIYNNAVTSKIILNFVNILSMSENNSKTMLYGFHRSLYIKNFKKYINDNLHKYNI